MARDSYHHGDLRAALLRAAAEAIAEDGLDAASTRSLARRVGVAPSAVFRHFSDKRALMTAYAAEGLRDLAGEICRRTAHQNGQALLRARAEAYLDFALSQPHRFRAMFRADLLDRSDRELRAAEAMLEGALGQGPVEPGAAANDMPRLAQAAIHGLATLALESGLGDALPDDPAERRPALMAMLRRLAPALS
ncbi:TetR/AcrR family transcriptional regulator [Roseitranquillus sediminis]|uniref:TetR/AcrR family transcriptional regulator n=1 Tax=Roseitranquillus sediminis TaxID=2809051 RepID=UPI001D0C77F8|nr:TetR/AcrR family transcriptional regulator [Roseitranquillus sediminis]MBM9594139.1 TetR/AcrR family transcriptional regulator [Roseitranquillus sediminis]